MNGGVDQIHHIVVTPTKSVGVSLLLTFFFGPVGMLYSTVWGALLMIVVTIPLAIITFGFGLVLIWPISMVWGAVAVALWNRKVIAMVSRQNGGIPRRVQSEQNPAPGRGDSSTRAA